MAPPVQIESNNNLRPIGRAKNHKTLAEDYLNGALNLEANSKLLGFVVQRVKANL